MPLAQVAASHYEPDGIGDGRMYCVNVYPEKNEIDPNRPYKHVIRPGSLDRDTGNVISGNIRGVGQADGHASSKVLVVDGATVRLFNPSDNSWSAMTGTLAGTDRVQMAFSEVQGAVLANGTIYVSTGTAVAAASSANWATLLSDHGQTAFTSIATIGQRLIATYGNRFAFSTTLQFNTTTTLSYYTAENTPDALVGCIVIGSYLYLIGTESIEIWSQTGDEDDPFRPQTSSVVTRGGVARDTIRLCDNGLFFVADDYSVRRLDGLTPVIISEPWVARALRAEDKADLVASVMEVENHTFYIINGLNVCLCYDVSIGTWTVRKTYGSDTWEPTYIIEASGNHYAASRSGGRFVQLSRTYTSDYKPDAATFGTHIISEFSAHLPVLRENTPISAIRYEGVKGRGSAQDVFDGGSISMRISRDNGVTYGFWREAPLGAQGEYSTRAIWRRNGLAKAPQTVLHFRTNDPGAMFSIALEED